MFKNQEDCDASYVYLMRENLLVFAESTGKIGGMLSHICKNQAFDCEQKGYHIPRGFDELMTANTVEKWKMYFGSQEACNFQMIE